VREDRMIMEHLWKWYRRGKN